MPLLANLGQLLEEIGEVDPTALISLTSYLRESAIKVAEVDDLDGHWLGSCGGTIWKQDEEEQWSYS